MTQNNKPSTLPPPIDFARELVDVLTDRQAEDIVLLDMTRLQGFADYFIIATVDNIRLAGAVVDSLRARLKEAELAGKHEGNPEDGWLLVTCGQGIVVHLFSPERRRFYDLEGLWSEASEILRVQ
ncbi:MAG: ribosome silencing factor [Dehalococcoidia bacterium]|nr:ribosome silencing factor [Dehalococcoidia bacterium]